MDDSHAKGPSWGLTIAGAILVGLAMAAAYTGLASLSGGSFQSNGERIYFTATSSSGQPITAEMGNMSMQSPQMACVDCHGPDGRGGPVWMMMGSFEAPDIRYRALTSAEHEEEGEEHPPYTDELIKQAFLQGINPAGEALSFPMPRWRMSDADAQDLLEYLQSLE